MRALSYNARRSERSALRSDYNRATVGRGSDFVAGVDGFGIFAGGGVHAAFEDIAEIALRGKPALECDLRQGGVGRQEQPDGFFDPLFFDIVAQGFSDRSFERVVEVDGTHQHRFCDSFQP